MARIAVIGAGMGAMAAAARLAVAGHRVAVYERAETYGGALGVFERDGFRFDTGPGLLPLPAVYRDLFLKTGKQPLEECVELVEIDPSARHLFADGSSADLPNASRAGVVEALGSALGDAAGERWDAYLNRARDAWDRTRRPLLEEPLWPNWRVLAERDPYPAPRGSGLLRRRPPTFAESARRELSDPRLIALVESPLLAHGLDPRSTPAAAAVLPYLEQAFGIWYVKGGLRELARALYERCLARRVEFHFGAEAVAVVEKEGRASGIELADGTVVDADQVVAGVDPARLGTLTDRPLQHAEDVRPDSSRTPPSRCSAFLALRGAPGEDAVHRTVVHAPDRRAELDRLAGRGGSAAVRPTVTVLRPDDPALRPDDDHESVVVTATVPGQSAEEVMTVEQLITAAEAVVPDLRERLLWHEVHTPADVEKATGAPHGAVPAPALPAADGRFLHPANSTRMPGLHLVGGWAHPGGGLPHAGMSGALVAGLIVEGPEFRGSQ
ncbi:Dehydrosqualene desaturase [Streptomyces sp. YIM 130001]|uniref:phytoene desaturase family protein n=1 Tax=Streptomyces sp. YIM 130001 TaxID=2259644 RepID=UPI000EC3AB17|nr:NAD(P)/FAD-dependent oxidoreductase [Streptomyces sp. YIM 130001]RII18274.1 Dehydrosqualene desaturase [Streptomyces sp. YIM 130001]